MKQWRETAAIVERIVDLAARGHRAALATVIRIDGSAYRRPGARFLVEDDGRTLGGVSGGCLEADVRDNARRVIDSGVPRLLDYDTGSDDRTVWGLGLGCNGSVEIFVQSATAGPALDMIQAARLRLGQADTFAIATIVEGPDIGRSLVCGVNEPAVPHGVPELDEKLVRLARAALADRRSRVDRLDSRLVFTDVLIAPPKLIVCGAGDDAVPVVAYAADAGFAVTVVDHRPAYLSAGRFPHAQRVMHARAGDDIGALAVDARTFVLVKMHAFEHDCGWLNAFLRTEAPYIGLLGPRDRAVEMLRRAGAEGDRRVFGPVGLDIAAEGPEQIAISIVAELLAVHGAQQPGHLRERGAAIHAV